MKNKYYNIFLTSESDGFGKSFRLSKISLSLITGSFTVMFCLSYIGFNRFVGQDEMAVELDQLREYKHITSQLLIESGVNKEVINSEDLEKIIVEYIIANNITYPNSAPVEGYVTKGIDKSDGVIHAGLDIASKMKDQVKSPLSGIVVSAINGDLGKTIILHHQNDFFTIYGYLDTMFVEARDLVKKGQSIGKVGKDKNANGPHLYFEIWKGNQVMDPRELISAYREKDVSIK